MLGRFRRLVQLPRHKSWPDSASTCFRVPVRQFSAKARSNVVSEHPFVFAGLAGAGMLGAYMAYMYTTPRYGLPECQRVNIGGYEVASIVKGSGEPTVVLDMGTVGEAYPLMELLAKKCTVLAFDRQGCGGSDVHPSSADKMRFAEVMLAARLMTDEQHPQYTADRPTALSRAHTQIKMEINKLVNNAHPDRMVQPGGKEALPERITMSKLEVQKALKQCEATGFAPPQAGVSDAVAAKDLAKLLNATNTNPPVIVVSSKGNWPLAAEFAAKNGAAVSGIVLVDSLQGRRSKVTRSLSLQEAPEVVRLLQLLEHGLQYTWAGRGRDAIPPMARSIGDIPEPFTSISTLRKVLRHVVMGEDVEKHWKLFNYVSKAIGADRDESIASVSDDTMASLASQGRPIVLCLTDPFFTIKGQRRLRSILSPVGEHLPAIDYTKFRASIDGEVANWKADVPTLRVVDGTRGDPLSSSKRWELVAEAVFAVADDAKRKAQK